MAFELTTESAANLASFRAAAGAAPAFSGALVRKVADQTTANFTVGAALTWDSEVYDTAAYHSTSVNTSRITIPAGGDGYYRLSAEVALSALSTNEWVRAYITKNGSATWDGAPLQQGFIDAATSMYVNLSSAVIPAVATDYFELNLVVEADTSITIVAALSWFSIQRLA